MAITGKQNFRMNCERLQEEIDKCQDMEGIQNRFRMPDEVFHLIKRNSMATIHNSDHQVAGHPTSNFWFPVEMNGYEAMHEPLVDDYRSFKFSDAKGPFTCSCS